MTDQELLNLIRQRRTEDYRLDQEFDQAVRSKDSSWLSRLIERVVSFFKKVVENGLISAILKFFGL